MPNTSQYASLIPAYTAAHLAANASTLVKTGAGTLHTININKLGATANTMTVYDGIDNTGAVLAVIDTTANAISRYYDVSFATGLYVVIATGTAPDSTISYV